jgi:hypothetical protein
MALYRVAYLLSSKLSEDPWNTMLHVPTRADSPGAKDTLVLAFHRNHKQPDTITNKRPS